MSWTELGIRKLKNSKSLEPIFSQQIRNLGKHIRSKSKKISKRLEQLAELVNTYLMKLPEVPPNVIIMGNVHEFLRANGISIRKALNREPNDNAHYSIMLLNSLGISFKYRIGGRDLYILTLLGGVIRNATKELDIMDKLAIIAIAGLLFHTKARIIAEAIALNVNDAESLYKLLRPKPCLGYITPLRPLIEVVNELKSTYYGTLKGVITETHVVLSALAGIGMINYDRKNMLFSKREEADGYKLYLNVPLLLRLIHDYGDPNWILFDTEYASRLMAAKEEVNKLPKIYLTVLEEIAKEKDRIKATLAKLYEL